MVAMIFYFDGQKNKLYKVANSIQEQVNFYWEAVDLYGEDKVEVIQY